ncbi:MAG: hypothetical protein HC811_00100 [Flammeovirgaceae bacterium]|nr:hypothetical protein [Flammeovirgaceae bacterium]
MFKLVLYTGILAGLIWLSLAVGLSFDWWDSLPSFSTAIILSQWIGVILVLFVLKMSIKNPARFTNEYLLSIVLKLIVFGGLILVFIFIDRNGAVKNALLFIICYGAFTTLEVSLLFRKLRS